MTRALQMTLSSGTRLGAYEIAAPLGAGGMGEVYRARDTRLGRDVAVKVLPEALAADVAALQRFEAEARAVAALSHPHILSIHDNDEAGQLAARAYAAIARLTTHFPPEPFHDRKIAERVASATGAKVVDFAQFPGGLPSTETYVQLIDKLVSNLSTAMK